MGVPQQERATRESWPNIKPLPEKRARLAVERTLSEQECRQVCLGFIPERMEDKWFIFVEDEVLYIHRSWTGYCIYQLALVKQGDSYVVGEAFTNRDEGEYSGGSDSYDEKMALFLIDHLLLNRSYPMPLPMNVPTGIATELHYSHVLGAGQRPEAEPLQPTVRGTLAWLGRWLLGLIRR